jgi:hydroxymethylglutaryl-CoA lyase
MPPSWRACADAARFTEERAMGETVVVNEVGLRDGLQNQPQLVPTADKLALLEALLAAGVRSIEATSFVSPKAVPQMADAAELMARLPQRDRIAYSVLVPNLRGYERALAAGARSVALVLACTETMNRRNINMTLETATAVVTEVIGRARADGIEPHAYLATAFICPFEGAVESAVVHDLAARVLGAGAREVIVADTIGGADPVRVSRVFAALVRRHGAAALSGHFHDTKGMALANCFAALEQGIRKFDAAIGGLGGCPFAPGAAGNAATEDLVNMLETAGYETGIALDRLAIAVQIAERCTRRMLGGRWMGWYRSQNPSA